jgi:uncharacterized protein with von Willebrand factor type A (vWA) domain
MPDNQDSQKVKAVAGENKTEEQREAWLGDRLRRMYHQTVNEPLPDRFSELLAQLDQKADQAASADKKDKDQASDA